MYCWNNHKTNFISYDKTMSDVITTFLDNSQIRLFSIMKTPLIQLLVDPVIS